MIKYIIFAICSYLSLRLSKTIYKKSLCRKIDKEIERTRKLNEVNKMYLEGRKQGLIKIKNIINE